MDSPSNSDIPWKQSPVAFTLALSLALAWLLSGGTRPHPAFVNEWVVALGLGLGLLLASVRSPTQPLVFGHAHAAAAAAVAMYLVGLAISWGYAADALALGSHLLRVGYAFAFLAAAALATWIRNHDQGTYKADRMFAWAFLAAGGLTAVACLVQVLLPELTGSLIPPLATPGRAEGFVRQSNHAATLLLIAAVAAAWLVRQKCLSQRAGALLLLVLWMAILATGARMPAILFLVLALVVHQPGASDRARRLLLLAAVLVGGAALLLILSESLAAPLYLWHKLDQTQSEGLGVRTRLWRESLELALRHPWTGVGALAFGPQGLLTGFSFNQANILSHAHNLPIQLVAEFGVPVGGAIVLLLLLALVLGFRSRDRNSAMLWWPIVLAIGLHAMVELPLNYLYFLALLGLAFAMGIGGRASQPAPALPAGLLRAAAVALAACLLIGAVWIHRDYHRITRLFGHQPYASLAQQRQALAAVFWFAHYRELAEAVRIPIDDRSGAQDYVARMTRVGCQALEPWLYARLAVALARVDRPQEAAHFLYLHKRLNGGDGTALQQMLDRIGGEQAPALAAVLQSPVAPPPVPPRAFNPCFR